MSLIGHFTPGDVIEFNFTTRQATGAPTAGTSIVLGMYKNAQTTAGTSGLTYTASFNAVAGLNHVTINSGNDTTYFSRGAQIDIAVTAGSVNGVSVIGEVVGRAILDRPQNYSSFVIDNGGTAKANAIQWAGTSIALDAQGLAKVDVEDFGGAAGSFTSGRPAVQSVAGNVAGDVVGNVQGNVLGFVAGPVSVGTNRDKTGYALAQAFPANFSAFSIDAGGTAKANAIQFASTSVLLDAQGLVKVDVEDFGGSAGAFTSGRPAVQSVTGAVGSVTGNVGGDVVGNLQGNVLGFVAGPVTIGTNRDKTLYGLTAAQVFDNSGQTTALPIQSNLKKNQALSGFEFIMTDSTNHNPSAGLTVSGFRSLDGGPFTSIANTVGNVGNGFYRVDLPASDLNANTVGLRFVAASSDDQDITIVLQP